MEKEGWDEEGRRTVELRLRLIFNLHTAYIKQNYIQIFT